MATVIIDSGSSKADWRLVNDSGITGFRTAGMNPYFTDAPGIQELIDSSLPAGFRHDEIENIFFYGAGCGAASKKEMVRAAFHFRFSSANIVVETDLLGAARGLLQREKGMIAILGTGTNTGLYDGKIIVKNIDSAGYFLGDEGSGAHLGKLFLRSWLRNEFSREVNEKVNSEFHLDREEVFEQLYQRPHPNRFLARFALFIHANLSDPHLRSLVAGSFDEFITNLVSKYECYEELPLFVTGSVAYFFRELFMERCHVAQVKIGSILQSPADGLVEFHS